MDDQMIKFTKMTVVGNHIKFFVGRLGQREGGGEL